MSDAVLDPAEIAALREDMKPNARQAATIELTNSERLVRKNLAGLERSLRAASPKLQAALTKTLRQSCTTDAPSVDVVGPQVATAQLGQQTLLAELRRGGEWAGYIGIDAALSFHLLERTFGGLIRPVTNDNPALPPPRDSLTEIERNAVGPTALELATTIVRALPDTGHTKVQLTGLAAARPEGPLTADGLVMAAWNCSYAGHTATIVLLLAPSVSAHAQLPQPPAFVPQASPQLGELLAQAPLEVCAHLGTARLSLAELLALRPGDVVRLDRGQGETLAVFVEGEPKYGAHPVQRRGVFAVEIAEVHS